MNHFNFKLKSINLKVEIEKIPKKKYHNNKIEGIKNYNFICI